MNKFKECRFGKVIYNDKDTYIGKAFEKYGEYSQLEVDFLSQLVRPGDIILDVGANIGGLTMPFSQLVGENGRVFAFEPQRWIFYMLCGNIAINNMNNVYCINCAVGETEGSMEVPEIDYSHEGNYGNVTLGENKNWDDKGILKYVVPLITLDKVPVNKCNLIKIDVEGMELGVLKGGRKFIEKYKPFLYIENDREDNEEKVESLLKEMNYEVFNHSPDMYNPDNFFQEEENIFGTTASKNIFCKHKDSDVTVLTN